MTGGSEIEKTVAAILAGVRNSGSKELDAWHHPERDIRGLAQREYAPSLHRQLDRVEVEEIVRAARTVLPGLNRDHDPELTERWLTDSPSSALEWLFSRVIHRLDIHFQGAPFTGPDGFAVRGFFVNRDDQSLQRPLIYVNTAHHPVAAAATLFHEVGHLVASRFFAPREGEVHFFFDADYVSHLDDVEELSADIVLSLVAYPAAVARDIFGTPWNWGALTRKAKLSDEAFCQVSEHFRARFGVTLASADLPARRKLNYLAGMIHFAKLRSALLAEYGI